MTKVIKIENCAMCPHIRVGYNDKKEKHFDYCNMFRGQTIDNHEVISPFCELEDEDGVDNSGSGDTYTIGGSN